jgi:hypothetical protein
LIQITCHKSDSYFDNKRGCKCWEDFDDSKSLSFCKETQFEFFWVLKTGYLSITEKYNLQSKVFVRQFIWSVPNEFV